MFYISSWYAMGNPTFLLCGVYYHGHVCGAVQFYMNLIWTWHSYCQATGKQHLSMGSAAVQTVPGVPGQHRGTCLLSSRIHRGNSGFHHCPLFYALYSTSQEIRGRHYVLHKNICHLIAAGSLSLPLHPKCGLWFNVSLSGVCFTLAPCDMIFLHKGSTSDKTAFTHPCGWGSPHFQGPGGLWETDFRYVPAAAIGTIHTGKQMRAILHH